MKNHRIAFLVLALVLIELSCMQNQSKRLEPSILSDRLYNYIYRSRFDSLAIMTSDSGDFEKNYSIYMQIGEELGSLKEHKLLSYEQRKSSRKEEFKIHQFVNMSNYSRGITTIDTLIIVENEHTETFKIRYFSINKIAK